MTELRDQFAMAALTGLFLMPKYHFTPEAAAKYAYAIADAMMEARGPQREPGVDDLDLSVRAANFLQAADIKTIAELKKHDRQSLRDQGCSVKTAKEIFAELERSGL